MTKGEKTRRSRNRTEELQRLVDRIAGETKPTEDEILEAARYSNSIMGRLKNVLPKDVEVILAGSVARGTQISGSSDIDIFMQFPRSMDERKMEHKAVEIAKGIVDKKTEYFMVNYAEHPYIKVIERRTMMSADIVPSFKITDAEEMASAVDRTPLHNIFVNSHLKERQKGEARALKYFLQQHDIYGAEARIGGFSGYLCEILIYAYGGFVKCVGALSGASPPILIDPLRKKTDITAKELDAACKKFGSSFVVVDPVDPNRNVAAAVSEESLARLAFISRRLFKDPSSKNFYRKKHSDVNAKAKVNGFARRYGLSLYTLAIKTDDISEDTLWPQIVKLSSGIDRMMRDSNFLPIMMLQDLHGREALISVFTNSSTVNSYVIEGPKVFMARGTDSFYAKHTKSDELIIDGDRIKAIRRTRFPTVKSLLGYVAKDRSLSFPSHLHKRGARIVRSLDERRAKRIWAEMCRKRA